MVIGFFLTVRMDVSKKDVIYQFLLVILVNTTYSAMNWFAAMNAIILPLCRIVVPLFDRRVWWHAT